MTELRSKSPDNNPYRPPLSDVGGESGQAGYEYVGFFKRGVAMLIDSLLLLALLVPLLAWLYGDAIMAGELPGGPLYYFLNYVAPAAAVILFWMYKSSTPGKMLFGAIIVDAASGGKPSAGQLVIRYFAYIISTLPLLLGFFWIIFDARKQGFHDKLANTLVVRKHG
jgi:uncharacterized RDD family membrane protein YckC